MASSSVRAMMAKAATTSPAFFSDSNSVQGRKERKDAIRRERKERGATLSQWYGMRKANLGAEQRRELELLHFRNFVNPELKHQAPKKSSNEQTEFVEFGFFAGTGRNKRRRLKSFADEWIAENPELEQVVAKRLKRNVRLNRKTKQIVAKKAAREAARAKAKKTTKRPKKKELLF
ncbi:nucleolus protein required for cell viability [Trypanosoma conorhini]|uniref:Nucleolus protein required for cell viability n=1 Tax=Trypanosoma conorhini TaxID=83891 RepID=A0A3S5ISR9_9TRYP|nr:nucleolus protein required for cell viability [Trypanosoma conorhini]RNF12983.1 nucleolus protein required for cell viability [Trypanosoma conorhini]